MQSKKLILFLGLLVVVVGAAAYLAGRMLNGNVGPLGLGMPIGNGGMISISVQVTPASELPTRKADVMGLFVDRKDNSIIVSGNWSDEVAEKASWSKAAGLEQEMENRPSPDRKQMDPKRGGGHRRYDHLPGKYRYG